MLFRSGRRQRQCHRARGSASWCRCPHHLAPSHLIANTLLHIRALDPQGLGKDLHDETLFQGILTVVHGYPGSSLTQKRIELVSPGDLGIGLEEALVAVAELAQALEGRAWNSGRS